MTNLSREERERELWLDSLFHRAAFHANYVYVTGHDAPATMSVDEQIAEILAKEFPARREVAHA